MPVNTDKWHASIGLFQSKTGLTTSTKFRVLRFVNYKVTAFLILWSLCWGKVQVNPKRKEITKLSLKLIQSFLYNSLQRVVLNNKISTWTPVLACVPQGSVLRPLFFLIYYNDLAKGISSTAKLFADDKSVFSSQWHQCICWPNE